ncbi:nb-arc and tpr domain protein [Colletotrichum asianum]
MLQGVNSMNNFVASGLRILDERQKNCWLAIYDNYDDFDFHIRDNSEKHTQYIATENKDDDGGTASKAYDIRPYFPNTEHGAIFITSRLSSVGRLGRSIQLEKLGDIQDSMKILASTCRRVDFADAGAYLKQASASGTEYNVTLQHIQLQNQQAVKLLRLRTYFNNHDLWFELLHAGGQNNEPIWLHELTEDKLTFDAAMRVVCAYGLAEPDAYGHEGLASESRGYSMHTCVHAWTAHVLNAISSPELAYVAIRCITSHADRRTGPESWLVRRRILPHADRLIATIDRDVEYRPSVCSIFGKLYHQQGRLIEDESMLEQALRSLEKTLRSDQILRVSEVFHSLGELYSDQDRLGDAQTMYERALQGLEKAFGLHHKDTLAIINSLGLLYSRRGQQEVAQAMLEQAVKGVEKLKGPDHPHTLTAIYNLGTIYARRVQLEDAKIMYERAYEGRKKVLGADHPQTLSLVHSMGLLYHKRGRLEDAR